MSYRYSNVDIIVGVGMCAIIFGTLLFFVAANGTYQAALPQPISVAEPVDFQLGMSLLQPALGQALVDRAIFERRASQLMAQSVSEWNRATLAQHQFQSLSGGALGDVMRQAATVPADHMARVQAVMGRAIVNFTSRGIRSGALSADQHQSAFNSQMIDVTRVRGERLDQEFASTWQATLGRGIVDAIQNFRNRAWAVQEQLGTAVLHLTQVQTRSEEIQAAQQEQLAGLVVAAVRTEALADRLALLAAIESFPEDSAVAFTEPASWPEIPLSYVIVAGLMLAAVFLGESRSRHGTGKQEPKPTCGHLPADGYIARRRDRVRKEDSRDSRASE